jgi:two-component system, NarL family, sensor histidine kinase DesK
MSRPAPAPSGPVPGASAWECGDETGDGDQPVSGSKVMHMSDGSRQDELGGPGWPVVPASMAPSCRPPLSQALWGRGALSWYFGGAVSLIWLLQIGQQVLDLSPTAWQGAVGIVLVCLFGLAYLLGVPIIWSLPARQRLVVPIVLLGLSLLLFPWLAWGVTGAWTYVGVVIGMGVLSWSVTWMSILGLGVVALIATSVTEGWSQNQLWLPVIIVSISLMMAAFARNLAAMNQLRATQRQVEELATERERTRVARDIHDILGHSLTVITVKAELAARLVDTDPERATHEIEEVEALSRAALADVRSTVAGFRGMNVSGEIAAARAALSAAGIEGELPGSTDAVPAAQRELVGWVVREGVTNVVRHSGASVCRVRLGAHEVEVADDGVGPGPGTASSTGLTGLRERVEASGGRMTVGRSDLGGFSLRVAM